MYGSPEEKDDHIKKVINNYELKSEQLLFFGDSNSDMDAASSMNLPFVLRLHRLNRNHFLKYTGQTIENFAGFDLDILHKE